MTQEDFERAIKVLQKHNQELIAENKRLEQEPCDDVVSRQDALNAVTFSEVRWQAIERIKQLPSVRPKSETVTEFADRCRECGAKYGKLLKQEHCDDVVSRQAVCEIINDIRDCISVEGYCAILERLKKLPSVRPQEQTGHWIEGSDTDIMGEKVYWYTCSNCNEDRGQKTNYCPNCGAKMVEPQESEDKE